MKTFSPREIDQIREALDSIRERPLSEPLIECKIENSDLIKHIFKILGFQIMKTGDDRIIRVRNFPDEVPEWHVFHGGER